MLGASRTSLTQARTRLADLASAGGADLGALSSDLFGLVELLGQELPLRRALADPSTPAAAKTGLLQALLRDRVGPATLELLTDLVGARWSRPRDLVDAVETLAVLASFEQAQADGTLDEVEDELFRFSRIVERESALRDALADSRQSPERRRALLEGLLQGKVGAVSLRVITAAALGSPRRRTLAEGLGEFAQLAAELRERLNARVTVAVVPTDEQLQRLAAGLGRLYGKTIGLRVEVDPDLVGGLVIRVGDDILDASITRRLDAARRGVNH
jgi:F-type H+-transporting ATPase subunit delta